ncbi:hypothetical protein [Streptomyces monomycini]|uniref:hypothetical protein n=1 Tax=Streptomyces monomycini TaxID=371720 RepID=UPI0012FF5011|nr:hypothetical protein [Streptomyces monomycini]
MNEAWRAPSGDDTTVLPVGEDWDAVEAPAAAAELVLMLRSVEAPAIIDWQRERAWWLVPRGGAAPASWMWQRLQPAVLVRTTGPLIVPHAGRTAGVRWVKPQQWSGAYLAQPRRLAAALNAIHNAAVTVRRSSASPRARGGTGAGPG